MALTVVTLEKQDRIGTLTLNRPEKLNALNRSVIGEFAEAIDVVAADPDLKVLIIRGAGRAFSSFPPFAVAGFPAAGSNGTGSGVGQKKATTSFR